MGLNPRTKGQTGEREIADMLNFIIYSKMKELGYSEAECLAGMRTVQRNQLQSAIGGNDLTNCFGLSIEVKRQETLSVSTWWRQCCASAVRNSEMPVLLYRQNRKPWKAMTYVWINLPQHAGHIQVVAEFDMDSFKKWFSEWTKASLLAGAPVRS